MKKQLTILIALAISIAFADTKTDVAICAAKDSDAIRLICYDKLAKILNVDKPKSEVTVGKGKWVVSKETSVIDDSKKVTLLLDAEDTISGAYKSHTPTMILRCSENKTNAYIVMGVFLGSSRIKVLTRLDKNKATTKRWSISTDHKALFAPGGNVGYIKSLIKHDKLLVQVTPYGANPVMTTFDLRGLNEAITPLRKACHW